MAGATGFRAALRDSRMLLALAGAYAVAAPVMALAAGVTPQVLTLTLSYAALTLPIPVLRAILGALRAARQHPADQAAAIGRAWRRWRRECGAPAAIALLLLPPFMASFNTTKQLIPLFNPFGWDLRLAHWDRLLHGADPWSLLQPLLGAPAITFALNLLYYPAWFCLAFGSWCWIATHRHPRRTQFLASFLLLWILLGTVGGTLLSSAGPIFFAEVTGDGASFHPLLAYLQQVDQRFPLIGLEARDRLWAAYVAGEIKVGTGISAMPSLHVAVATLCAIIGWTTSRRAGAILTAFAAIVLVSSVHLGWHYAIDGYVSIVATLLIWVAVGKLLHRRAAASAPSIAAISPAREAPAS